jgi:UDPglucose--hexose-1-phosphate uridylyltransferase
MDKPLDTTAVWEERWHPLREEWVVVAAHRQNRPWSGEILADTGETAPKYLPDCYLCPGNARVSGRVNDDYRGAYVFDNDLPCVGAEAPQDLRAPVGLYQNRPAAWDERSRCRVACHR